MLSFNQRFNSLSFSLPILVNIFKFIYGRFKPRQSPYLPVFSSECVRNIGRRVAIQDCQRAARKSGGNVAVGGQKPIRSFVRFSTDLNGFVWGYSNLNL